MSGSTSESRDLLFDRLEQFEANSTLLLLNKVLHGCGVGGTGSEWRPMVGFDINDAGPSGFCYQRSSYLATVSV